MKVNHYFDDQVLSLSFDNSNGLSSIGVMEPGTYEFSTTQNERMVVISGALLVQLPKKTQNLYYILTVTNSMFQAIKRLMLKLLKPQRMRIQLTLEHICIGRRFHRTTNQYRESSYIRANIWSAV